LKSETESKERRSLAGKIAITESPLNPFGTALIDGRIFDVQTNGKYIDSGRGVHVIRVRRKKVYVVKV
jgi:membrane-bound ClpP family serine protease